MNIRRIVSLMLIVSVFTTITPGDHEGWHKVEASYDTTSYPEGEPSEQELIKAVKPLETLFDKGHHLAISQLYAANIYKDGKIDPNQASYCGYCFDSVKQLRAAEIDPNKPDPLLLYVLNKHCHRNELGGGVWRFVYEPVAGGPSMEFCLTDLKVKWKNRNTVKIFGYDAPYRWDSSIGRRDQLVPDQFHNIANRHLDALRDPNQDQAAYKKLVEIIKAELNESNGCREWCEGAWRKKPHALDGVGWTAAGRLKSTLLNPDGKLHDSVLLFLRTALVDTEDS